MDASHQSTWLEMAAPVPLRTLFLFYLAPVLLALNIKGLRAYAISLSTLLGCRTLSPTHLLRFFLKLCLIVLLPALCIHNVILEQNRVESLEVTRTLLSKHWGPSFTFTFASLMTLFLLIMPFNRLYKTERYMLLGGLKRTIFGGFQSEVYFCDVVLADILTSYSRVLGDFFSSGWKAFFLKASPESNAALWSDVLAPLIISLPFFFRLRQCVSEFLASGCTSYRHIANALKYASAFPVVFLSPIVSKIVFNSGLDEIPNSKDDILAHSTWLYHSWIFFVVINSFYSFLWDIFMDWDLGHFLPVTSNGQTYSEITPSSSSSPVFSQEDPADAIQKSINSTTSKFKYFLRPILHFSDPSLYYLVVVINFFLRITWTFKLSRQFDINHAPFGDFLIEFLELVRRFLWVFLRLEKEFIHTSYPQQSLGPAEEFKP